MTHTTQDRTGATAEEMFVAAAHMADKLLSDPRVQGRTRDRLLRQRIDLSMVEAPYRYVDSAIIHGTLDHLSRRLDCQV